MEEQEEQQPVVTLDSSTEETVAAKTKTTKIAAKAKAKMTVLEEIVAEAKAKAKAAKGAKATLEETAEAEFRGARETTNAEAVKRVQGFCTMSLTPSTSSSTLAQKTPRKDNDDPK